MWAKANKDNGCNGCRRRLCWPSTSRLNFDLFHYSDPQWLLAKTENNVNAKASGKPRRAFSMIGSRLEALRFRLKRGKQMAFCGKDALGKPPKIKRPKTRHTRRRQWYKILVRSISYHLPQSLTLFAGKAARSYPQLRWC